MAQRLYKGRTNNHLTWAMVDATDYATPESALSAATKIKIYGKVRGATGVNFVSSGTGSLTNDIQHVGASALGLYTIALAKADLSDASAAWYDQYIISLSATGAAYQAIIAEGVIDDSTLSGVISDIYSALVALSDATSNAYSAAVQANSRVLLVQSRLSDLDSRLVSDLSDVYSAAVQTNSRVLVVQSMASDAASAAAQGNSRVLLVQSRLSDFDSRVASDLSDLYSALSDFQSDFGSRVPKLVATSSQVVAIDASALSDIRSAITAKALSASDLSDVASAVWADAIGARVDSLLLVVQSQASDIYSQIAAGVTLEASTMSDIRSAVAAITVALDASAISDIASAVAAAVTTVTPSDISDIASAVWAHAVGARVDSRVLVIQSAASDAASAAAQVNSRVLALSGIASDIYSALAAGVEVGPSSMSDLRSAITAGGGATIDASNISDIASAVWANTIGARVDSRVRLIQSQASDTYSLLASRVPKAVATQSQVAAGVPIDASGLSDIRSAIAATELDASDLSDIASAVWANTIGARVDSRLRLVQSDTSDIYSAVLAGVPLGASDMSDIRSMVAATELDASDLSDIASAVWARAGADPTGVVSPTGTMGAKMDWMAALARNQITQTSGVQTLYDDSLSAIASAVVSDDGSVFTRGSFA